MQKRHEQDWVGNVLRDMVTFLAENEMMQSAQMLTIAAAQIEREMKRQKPVPQPNIIVEANVVRFPSRNRRLV
jgi:hypothetical protein